MARARRSRSPFIYFVGGMFFILLATFYFSSSDSDQKEEVVFTTGSSNSGVNSGVGIERGEVRLSSTVNTRQRENGLGETVEDAKTTLTPSYMSERGGGGLGIVQSVDDSSTSALHVSKSSSKSSTMEERKWENADLVETTAAIKSANSTGGVDCRGILDGTIESKLPQYCECFSQQGAANDPRFFNVNVNIDGTPFSINVYKRGDIVSNMIMRERRWEIDTSRMFVKLMNDEYRKRAQSNPSLQKSDLTFLDIGANIGWYSLLMAATGFKVIAIEPMTKNFDALRSSICVNGLQNSITIHKTGLSETKRECKIVSDVGNTGDGIIVCDDAWEKATYETREIVHINRLDDLIPENEPIVFAKIDVEGYEDHVLGGANKVLLHSGISKIMSELSPRMMGDAQSDPVHYLKMWSDAGYTIRKDRFGSGSVIQPSTFKDVIAAWNDQIVNIFMEKENP